MSGGEVALVITASSTFVTAVATGYAIVRASHKVESTHKMVEAIDRAVNGKEPGEQTMVSQVDDIHAELPVKRVRK